MSHKRSAIVLGSLATVIALTVTACGGTASTKKSNTGKAGAVKSGGTLFYLSHRPVQAWDPQRVYIGVHISNEGRLFTRTLLIQPATEDAKEAVKLQPDLATDLGTSSDGAKTWKFTLKTGVKWEDGKDVTCADLKYGVSRTFAVDVITNGPNYTIGFLDIPKDPKGGSAYKGPYTKVGQALFDKAVSCEGQTITFHFNKPWADFPYAASSALMFLTPYRADKDQGDKSKFAVFSDGPYKLQGTWDKDKGGTFVRNDQWDAKSDPVRKAYPDKIVFVQGPTDEVIAQRLIANQGDDKTAITDRNVPPALLPQAFNSQAVKARLTNPVSPFVDYFIPNVKKLTNVKVRQALAVATDKAGWITAAGGSATGTVAKSIMAPTLLGYKDANVFGAPDNGDPAKAKQLLQEAGVPIPYPITFIYSGGTPTTQKEAAVMKQAWEKGGFKVTLTELTDTYYDVIANPANAAKYDVAWTSWGADWPSGSTVIPALFDDRINLLSKESNGQDYGNYANPDVDKAIDVALNKEKVDDQAAAWADIDQTLSKDVAYIPLEVRKFVFLRGSSVKGYLNSVGTATYPDLAGIGVQ